MLIPRFYPILDTEVAARHGLDFARAAAEILEAGARILQLRHKGAFSREMFSTTQNIADLCARFNAIFVMNDRADLARIFAAALHLGQDDLTPAEARRITGPDTLIGYSTHNESQIRSAAGESANYLAFGPIFPTLSKQNPDPVAGVAGLRRLRGLTDRPVVAIGGITRDNARTVIEAGADSVAVIGDLYPEVAKRTGEFIARLA